MQLHKIKQYSLIELLRIAFYRFFYEVLLTIRKTGYKFRSYSIVPFFNKIDVKNQYCAYFYRVRTDKSVLDVANKILHGQIYLFEQWFDFDYSKDWLRDPISKNYWKRDVYSYRASFFEENRADVKYILEANKLNPIVKVAQAYYISKDEKFVHFIKDSINSWKVCVPVEGSVVNRIVMDIAYRAINLIHISLLCYDSKLFRSDVFPSILGILQHHEDYMWARLGCRWFKSNNDNNHSVGEIVGLYITQIWLHDFLGKDYSYKQDKEIHYLVYVLDKIISPSGAYIEQSGNYTKVVAEFIDLLELFLCSSDDSVSYYFKKNYKNRLLNYLSRITYNDIIDNFGDNDGAVVLLPFEKNTYSIEHLGVNNLNSDNVDYSDSSQWVYNSSDGRNVHIFIRAGKHAYYVEGAFIHAHNDNLSVILGMYGSRLFIDKGCFLYNSGIDVRKDYTCISSHNVVCFEGIDSSQIMTTGFKNYPVCELCTNQVGANSATFKGNLKYNGIFQERSVTYEEGVVRVVDSIIERPNDSNSCIISYLLGPTIVVQSIYDNKLTLKDTDNNNLFGVEIEGVENVETNEERYYPSYGVSCMTHRIIAKKILTSNTNIVTTIRKI